ncbi:AAA family ATPase [Actinacidiphila glaucinigra]|uniref:ATP-dependent nuclease n=1 Tax=Actinacidiphila glaucinigra TaxID=235986 RepID=UPI0033A1FD36
MAEVINQSGQNGLYQTINYLTFFGNAEHRMGYVNPVELRSIFSQPPASPLHVLEEQIELFEELDALCQEIFKQGLTLDPLSKMINLRVGKSKIPAPPVDSVTREYREALTALPFLSEQGDGMKSLIGLLLPLVTATYPVVLIDEPEAFLHPPQALRLGRTLGEQAASKGIQIILTTHDKNILAGLLYSGANISIARLDRPEHGATAAHQLDVPTVKELWSDPVLKYSNVLDGLFYRLVVLTEAERDCRFYAASLEDLATKEQLRIPDSEVLFVPSGGKDGLPRLVKILRSVKVPVVASPDLDILKDKAKLRLLVSSFEGDWTQLEKDYDIATAPFRQPREKLRVGAVLSNLQAIFRDRESEDVTTEIRKEFTDQLRLKDSPWDDVKQFGEHAFRKEAGAAAQRLLDALDRLGIVAVRVGELECFAPDLSVAKGPAWLPAALMGGYHTRPDAHRHVRAALGPHLGSTQN